METTIIVPEVEKEQKTKEAPREKKKWERLNKPNQTKPISKATESKTDHKKKGSMQGAARGLPVGCPCNEQKINPILEVFKSNNVDNRRPCFSGRRCFGYVVYNLSYLQAG